MSRPDRAPQIAVDFSPPRPAQRRPPLVVLALVGLVVIAAVAVVTQLVLR